MISGALNQRLSIITDALSSSQATPYLFVGDLRPLYFVD